MPYALQAWHTAKRFLLRTLSGVESSKIGCYWWKLISRPTYFSFVLTWIFVIIFLNCVLHDLILLNKLNDIPLFNVVFDLLRTAEMLIRLLVAQ